MEIPWTQEVELRKESAAVLVVDMQNDFVQEKGALRVPTAAATVPAIQELLRRARDAGARVVFTQDWHAPDAPEFQIWPAHCVAGTWGAEIIPELAPQENEPRIRKTTYDPFYQTELEELLCGWSTEHLVVVGTVANICVLHAAGSAALRGLQVIIPKDAVSALTEFDLVATFRQLTFLYRGLALPSVAGVRFGTNVGFRG